MSILQEYEEIRKDMGEEKYNAIEKYLGINKHLYLSDLYYNPVEWSKFDNWYNKQK